jgi:hypothetical protein
VYLFLFSTFTDRNAKARRMGFAGAQLESGMMVMGDGDGDKKKDFG